MAKKQITGSIQEVNLTPMIDCTFQLIIFFILTAQMASQELAKVSLPEPVKSMAIGADPDKPDQPTNLNNVTVNVVNKYGDSDDNRQMELAGKAECYQLGQNKIDAGNIEALTAAIKERKAQILSDKNIKNVKEGDIIVEIRADKDIVFQDIEPVMRAAAEAKINKMSMTALVDPEHRVKR
ncbi:MAG TPA: biopolymer transporter ExbD [Phycisphaerae bacterium]|nr:biopolymer transporter ExbD [Phycisphaerae bacterium]